MFVFSFKASTLKYIGVMSLCTVAIILTVSLVPSDSLSVGSDNRIIEVSAERKAGDFKNIDTNEDRIAFLKSYGWETDGMLISEADVVIPHEFDSLYEEYNQLQKNEGLNLEKYKGKKVKMYIYKVNNAEEDAYASILVYKNRVIGGDITAAMSGGSMYSFSGKESKTQ